MAKPLTPLALRARWTLPRLGQAAMAAEAVPGPRVLAMGLAFAGPVGLAAGFDRHGMLRFAAHRLGFASIEMGTLLAGQRRCSVLLPAAPGWRALCGVSLGKRPQTPWSRAEDDVLAGLAAHAAKADYVTLNPGHDRPSPERFADVLALLAQTCEQRNLPLVAKLPAAWMTGAEPEAVAERMVDAGAKGLLVSAEGDADALATLRRLAAALPAHICLISVGGIGSAEQALARLSAGARLVHLHRGVLSRGIALVEEINQMARFLRSGPVHRAGVCRGFAGRFRFPMK